MFSLHHFKANHLIRGHFHQHAKLNILLTGELLEFRQPISGKPEVRLHQAPVFWRIPARSTHSLRVFTSSTLISLQWSKETKATRHLYPWIAALMSIQAASACEYTQDDIDRLIKSETRPQIPGCFFDQLEKAAAGGDAQAQLNLGIVDIEGLNPRTESPSNEGIYWIRKSAQAGHPRAAAVLESYTKDLYC